MTYGERDLGEFRLHVPGVHNVLNATAAIAVGIGLDIPAEEIRAALENFRGVDRRFQLRGKAAGVSVIDDYGHHPTEIRATLAAARQCGFRKIHVIFSRTATLAPAISWTNSPPRSRMPTRCSFSISMRPAKRRSRASRRSPGPTDQRKRKRRPRTSSSFAEGCRIAVAAAQPGDMILTLGAGSVSQLGPMILAKLQENEAGSVSTPHCSLSSHKFFFIFSQNSQADNDFFPGPSNRVKENAMESEKLIYWVTLGVLALATTTGFVTEHRGWSDRLADRSIA